MGYRRHHAIIVTGCDLKQVHKKAKKIFPQVSEILPPLINFTESFFIPPDGSKEGWADSNEGDDRRQEFIIYLHRKTCDWVEVQYGDDEGINKVVRANK